MVVALTTRRRRADYIGNQYIDCLPSYSMPPTRPETLTPLSTAILFALADGASHGYAIIKEIQTVTGGEMRPNTGSMYLALHRLLKDGLIVESTVKGEDARRRYYRLSDAGREAARAEARRLAQLVRVASAKRLIPRSAL
jgi:DNA-binding PadR family transcriptional regulator